MAKQPLLPKLIIMSFLLHIYIHKCMTFDTIQDSARWHVCQSGGLAGGRWLWCWTSRLSGVGQRDRRQHEAAKETKSQITVTIKKECKDYPEDAIRWVVTEAKMYSANGSVE